MLIGIFVLIMTMSGCVSLPTAEEAQHADYGAYPANYSEVVKFYYENVAKDPDSLKFKKITEPQKYWLGNRIDGAKYGYLVCATVNGKNSYGAYVGYATDALLIRNGKVIEYVAKGNWYGRYLCA
ncbi:hypothetical protein [Neisseria lactamica]|nr:hypothetical protein [Neisseria lactamica]